MNKFVDINKSHFMIIIANLYNYNKYNNNNYYFICIIITVYELNVKLLIKTEL